ncbi:MAG: DUF427 domain-containing protein [Marmoricola sp.]
MTQRPVLQPGPDHQITVEPTSGPVTIRFAGRVIARTDRALLLSEAGYPPVAYLPLDDVDHTVLQPSSHRTYCPYKGEASYFTLRTDDAAARDAVWCYERPYEAVADIAGYVAFNPEHVGVETG